MTTNKKDNIRILRTEEKEATTLLYDVSPIVALQRIHDYLEQSVDSFQEQSGMRSFNLLVHEFGMLGGLKQGDYKLQQLVRGQNLEVELGFTLSRRENASFTIPYGPVSEQHIIKLLKNDGVRIVRSRVLGSAGDNQQLNFEIKARIPVRFQFEADCENGVLRLAVHNFEILGIERYIIQPQQVDNEFLNQLGRFISRRRNVFLQHAMSTVAGYPQQLSVDESEEETPATETAAANIISLDPAMLAGQREIVLSYREMTFTFDRYRPECQFGRKFPAEILVRSRYVSRSHGWLRYKKNRFVFEDTSSNGTFIQLEGKSVRFLHQNSMVLKGSGIISLGVSIGSEKRDLIYFEVGPGPEPGR
jgi:hypothetical protein